VTLPLFGPTEDPGPSFVRLLDLTGYLPPVLGDSTKGRIEVAHGTTVVAIRFAGGVVMAGDRRATEGYSIAHRRIEKVFAADNFSGVAIAGAAGPAIELVKLFQTQLEHYEKVEGQALTLDGKANQLSNMVRSNLPMAMQGLVVVPLFAGYDEVSNRGRIFTYDVTGGRYEETDHHATGSGGRDARTTIKLGYREGMDRDDVIRLALTALYEAADEDSATGGPDVVRGIYPTVATITADGFESVNDSEVSGLFAELIGQKTVLSAGPSGVFVGSGAGSAQSASRKATSARTTKSSRPPSGQKAQRSKTISAKGSPEQDNPGGKPGRQGGERS